MLAVLLVLAVAAGCKKDKPKDDGKGGTTAGGKKDTPASAELKQHLALMPLQSDGVVGVDLALLRGSELYKAYQKDIEGAAANQLEQIKTLCGFDPLPKIQKVLAGGVGSRKTGDATAVIKGLGKAETMDCLTKAAAAPPPNVKVVVDGDFATVETAIARDPAPVPVAPPAAAAADPKAPPAAQPAPPPEPVETESVSVQFLDDTTAVIARRGGKAVDKAAMQALLATKVGDAANVTGSPGFMEMIDAIDTEAGLWFVVNGKSDRVKSVGRGILAFDAAFGHVYAGAGLDVHATLRVESEDSAKRMTDLATRQVASMRKSLMKDMLGEVEVEQNGRDVRFRLQESREQLEKLVDFAGSLLGGLLGN
jgi:hypothetical protein